MLVDNRVILKSISRVLCC